MWQNKNINKIKYLSIIRSSGGSTDGALCLNVVRALSSARAITA